MQVNEEQLRFSYSEMNQSVLIGEIIHDSLGKAKDYVVTDVNPAHELITGRKRDRIVGKKSSELCRVEVPLNRYLHIFAKAVESYKPISFEDYYQPLRKYFYFSVFPIDEKKFATTCLDITHYKRFGEKLLAYQEKLLLLAREDLLTEDHERTCIATEISGNVSQDYATCGPKLSVLKESVTSIHFATNLAEIRTLIEELLNKLSLLTFEIRSPLVHELGPKMSLEKGFHQPRQNDCLSCSVLTRRELVVLKCIAEGRSIKEIAADLCLSVKTIETHRKNIMDKLNIHNMAELVKYSIREGLTSL